RRELLTARSTFQGALWLTTKMRLGSQSDVNALADVLGLAPAPADALRQTAIGRLSAALAGAVPEAHVIQALRAAGFIDYEAPPAGTTSTTVGVAAIPLPGTR